MTDSNLIFTKVCNSEKNMTEIFETFFSKINRNEKSYLLIGHGHPFYHKRLRKVLGSKAYIISVEDESFRYSWKCLTEGKDVFFIDMKDIKNLESILNHILSKVIKMKKFDCIIANAPYIRGLHLRILKEYLKFKAEDGQAVNLSPNFYEDYKELDKENVPVASSNDVILREKASSLFGGIQLPFNLSIQCYNGKDEDKDLLTKFVPEAYKVYKKIKFKTSFKDVNKKDYSGEKFFVPLKLMTATWDNNKDFIVDKLELIESGMVNGTPYKELRKRNKDRVCGGIPFDTKLEALNFIKYTRTKFFIGFVKVMHTNTRYILDEYPFLSDYTHEWTDEMLYNLFGLTDDDIRIIEDYVK